MKNNKLCIFFIFGLLAFILYLTNRGQFVVTKETNNEEQKNIIQTDSLLADAINNGNKKSFEKVLFNRVLIEGDTKMFYYSLLMANKYNDWRACEYIYNSLNYEKNRGLTVNNIEHFSNDKTTTKLAMYYLLKSYEFGNPDTLKLELKKVFKNNKIPKSSEFFYRTEF